VNGEEVKVVLHFESNMGKIEEFKVSIINNMIQRTGILLMSIFSTFFVAINYNSIPDGYKMIFILPFFFGIFHMIFPAMWEYRNKNIGIKIFNIVMVIRYLILPMVISCSSYYADSNMVNVEPSYACINIAILLMMYEMLVSFLIVQIFAHRIYSNNKSKLCENYNFLKSKFLLIMMIILAIILVLKYRIIIQRYHFFLITNIFTTKINFHVPFDGVIYLIVDSVFMLVPLLVINKLKRLYDIKPAGFYVLLSLIVVLPNIIIFRYTSRFSVFVPAIIWMFFLVKIYPEYKKRIISIISVVLFVALISVTLYKRFGVTEDKYYSASFNMPFAVNELDLYFSGPRSMGMAVNMKEDLDDMITPKTFENDLFCSVAIVSNYIDQSNTTPSIYNYYIYGIKNCIDRIIPLTGQGYSYFGFIFAPILMSITIVVMMWFDNKSKNEIQPEFFYIYTYMAIFMSVGMMLNCVIIFSFIPDTFIPLYIIFKLNRKVKLRIGGHLL
jgi:hypothetical protein